MDLNELNIIEVKNPTDEDYQLKWDGIFYPVKANSTKMFPEPLGRHYAEKMAKKLITANEGFGFVNDEALVKKYVDSLIVGVAQEGKKDERTNAQKLEESVNTINEKKDAIASLNDEDVELREELMAENNPAGLLAEELSKKSYKDLKMRAKELKIKVFGKTKEVLIDEIIKAQKNG